MAASSRVGEFTCQLGDGGGDGEGGEGAGEGGGGAGHGGGEGGGVGGAAEEHVVRGAEEVRAAASGVDLRDERGR